MTAHSQIMLWDGRSYDRDAVARVFPELVQEVEANPCWTEQLEGCQTSELWNAFVLLVEYGYGAIFVVGGLYVWLLSPFRQYGASPLIEGAGIGLALIPYYFFIRRCEGPEFLSVSRGMVTLSNHYGTWSFPLAACQWWLGPRNCGGGASDRGRRPSVCIKVPEGVNISLCGRPRARRSAIACGLTARDRRIWTNFLSVAGIPEELPKSQWTSVLCVLGGILGCVIIRSEGLLLMDELGSTQVSVVTYLFGPLVGAKVGLLWGLTLAGYDSWIDTALTRSIAAITALVALGLPLLASGSNLRYPIWIGLAAALSASVIFMHRRRAQWIDHRTIMLRETTA